MSKWILGWIKRIVLRLIESRGYALVKHPSKPDLGGPPAFQLPVTNQAAISKPNLMEMVAPPPEFRSTPDSEVDIDLRRFLDRSSWALDAASRSHAAGLFAAIRYLSKSMVPGDIVDCGEGMLENLVLAAAALITFGDTTRQLVMFDVTADPTHRPQSELPLWGSDWSDIMDQRVALCVKRNVSPQVLPKELIATCYPRESIRIFRAPFEMMDPCRPIALLCLTADTYETNRAAIRTLIPQVSSGGVLAVKGSAELRPSQPGCVQRRVDAVAQYLAESGIPLSFWYPAADFRIAVVGRS